MLEDALSYPTRGDSGLARILIGGGLLFLSFLIVPAFAVLGYYVEALAGVSRGEPEPPAFEEWGDLLGDGLKAFVVSLLYSLAVVPLFVVIFALIGFGGRSGPEMDVLFTGLGIVVFFLYMVAILAINYVLPAALTNLGREGEIGAAFDFGTLRPVLLSGTYVKAVLLIAVVGTVIGVLFTVGSLITFGLAFLAAPFLYFYLYLAGAYMFGAAFGETAGLGRSGTERAGAAPTVD